MKRDDRKAALAAYRERKTASGIVAWRCARSGAVWVGPATNLAAIENRLRFSLGTGGETNRPLQAAWNAHGGDAFALEILEVLDTDDTGRFRQMMLKDRAAFWVAELGAQAL